VSLIEQLAAALTPGEPPSPTDRESGGKRSAAVAVLLHDVTHNLRDVPDDPRVLLMKRAERSGDPWSGHISLPGGRYQSSDRDLLETAIRETREELNIDLEGARLLGHLPPLHPRTSGPLGIEVTPFVFVTEVAVEPTPGPEALAAFWLPLATAGSGSLDGTYAYPSSQMTFPSWNYEGYVIWGLTWRILADVLALARAAT
jgi:8-oxo-dGTP pyrophosphatase MutT (NUDIX family)